MPAPTVVDIIAAFLPNTRAWAKVAVEALGIDPHTPAETLERWLDLGRRLDRETRRSVSSEPANSGFGDSDDLRERAWANVHKRLGTDLTAPDITDGPS